jgi:hypothetical protein
LAAKAAGYSHVIIDGTLIETDRSPHPAPHPVWIFGGPASHTHGGNIQVTSVLDGWPIWTSQVRPGREHDTTAIRVHEQILPTLTEAPRRSACSGRSWL